MEMLFHGHVEKTLCSRERGKSKLALGTSYPEEGATI